MGGQGDGRDTGVCDADVGEAVDAEVGVDDAALVAGEHGAGGGGVEFGAGDAAEPVVPLLVCLDGGAGGGFAG